MNSLNSVLIEGTLVGDPVVETSPQGVMIAMFEIESYRFYKKEDEMIRDISIFRINAWSKLAEYTKDNLKKGKGVRIVGRLKGTNRVGVVIIAEHIEGRHDGK